MTDKPSPPHISHQDYQLAMGDGVATSGMRVDTQKLTDIDIALQKMLETELRTFPDSPMAHFFEEDPAIQPFTVRGVPLTENQLMVSKWSERPPLTASGLLSREIEWFVTMHRRPGDAVEVSVTIGSGVAALVTTPRLVAGVGRAVEVAESVLDGFELHPPRMFPHREQPRDSCRRNFHQETQNAFGSDHLLVSQNPSHLAFPDRYAVACRQLRTRDPWAEDRFSSDPED